ncbi:MAG: DUF167 domain-containing protein [Solirubrobacteraceae bacterium]|nr:DUF167 domain-containing protein [Solirubrobacteraceae bacterium]
MRGVPDHALIAVRVQPRAKRTEVAGERDGAVVIRVNAPPVDGKANDALCRFVAKAVGVPRGAVTVARGESGRDKLLRVEGLDAEAVRAALLA